MENQHKYLIIGGGLAAVSAISGIREQDPQGSIALLSRESSLPYNRPWLSKQLWTGKKKAEENLIRSREFYSAQHAALFLNTEAAVIRLKEKTVEDFRGNRFRYEKLLLATGGQPRRLDHDGGLVQYYRTLEDYQALRQATGNHENFLVVGGGFIGAELAAALTMNHKKVSMIFPDTLVLERILPLELAEFVTQYFRQKGIDIWVTDAPVSFARTLGGKISLATRAEMALETDFVVAGLGLNLNTRLASDAGLAISDGVTVNAMLQTSNPDIYAAGDIACFPSPAFGPRRVEHEDNAKAQGFLAGQNMAGAAKPYSYIPFFYSDLFDLGFEAVGLLDSRLQTFADWKTHFREGVVYYLREGKVKGVLLWNVWKKTDAAREIINSGKTFHDPGKLKGLLLDMAHV